MNYKCYFDNANFKIRANKILNVPMSYKKLALALNMPIKEGNAKVTELKELSRYANIVKTCSPTRYSIVEVYAKEKAPNPNGNIKEDNFNNLKRFCEKRYIKIVGDLPKNLKMRDKIKFVCPFHPDIIQEAEMVNLMKTIGCPYCHYPMSRFEVMIYLGIKDAQHRIKIDNTEFDIFIPSLNTLVEIDGFLYHNNDKEKERESHKYDIAKKNGYNLIKIYEMQDNKKSSNKVDRNNIYVKPYATATKEGRKEIISTIQQLLPYNHSDDLWDKAADYMREWKHNLHQIDSGHPIKQYDKNGNLIHEYKNFDEIKKTIISGNAFGFDWKIE